MPQHHSKRPSDWAGRLIATPEAALWALIVATSAARLAFAAMIGLGIDESYMVASGRQLALSYFDHPPLSWWLSWGIIHLTGSEAPIVVRLPFIALFALSTWLMYRLGAALYTPRAGLWAAVALNLAPVFGVTSGSWVLPDGPLDCALLGFALCFVQALPADLASGTNESRWGWWIGTGVCAGLALLSKYSAVLVFAGALLYLLTQPRHRSWLARPQPYAAVVVAVVLFAPVLIWNAQHGFASLAFQGGRAGTPGFHPLALLGNLGGGALYLLPWLWLPLMICLVTALRRGPVQVSGWLLSCLGIVPIALFALIAAVSSNRILYHWSAPGYLMLFPLLGTGIASRLERRDTMTQIGLLASGLLVLLAVGVMGSEVRWNWLPEIDSRFAQSDPALDAVEWDSLRPQLEARGFLGRPHLILAATNWHDTGKLDHGLRGTVPVICLGDDPRQFGLTRPARDFDGEDVLILDPRGSEAQVKKQFGKLFDEVDVLPPVTLFHAGWPALQIPVFLGHHLQAK